MLSIFAKMFSTATRSNWDAPLHWRIDENAGLMGEQRREAEEWRRQILRDTGMRN